MNRGGGGGDRFNYRIDKYCFKRTPQKSRIQICDAEYPHGVRLDYISWQNTQRTDCPCQRRKTAMMTSAGQCRMYPRVQGYFQKLE